MRKYALAASSDVRLAYGTELLLGLRQSDATRPLAEVWEPVQEDLAARSMQRKAADAAVVRARVERRFAEHRLEQAIRTLAHHGQIADENRVGTISKALFPDGLLAETVPSGARQEKRAKALLARLSDLRIEGIEPLRQAHLAGFRAAVEDFSEKLGQYEGTSELAAEAYARERQARDEHRTQLERIVHHVIALFPNDRVKQDLHFPVVEAAGGGEEGEELVAAPAT